jgi:hypothetical protein
LCVRWWPELLADLLLELGPLASRPSASRNPSYRSPAFALAAVWLASGEDGVVASQKRDEQGRGLDRNAHVTFETLKIAVDPIEPLSGGRFLTFISVRRKEAMAASATSERDCSRRSAKSASRRIID